MFVCVKTIADERVGFSVVVVGGVGGVGGGTVWVAIVKAVNVNTGMTRSGLMSVMVVAGISATVAVVVIVRLVVVGVQ